MPTIPIRAPCSISGPGWWLLRLRRKPVRLLRGRRIALPRGPSLSSSSASSSPSITTSPFSNSAYLSLPPSSRAMANLHRDLYPRVFGDAYTSTPRAGMKPPPWKSSRTLLVLSASSSRYASFVEVSEDGAEVAEATVRGRRDEHLNRVSEGRGHGATRVGRRVARMPRDKKEMPTPMTLPAVDIFRARVAVRVPS